VAEKALLVRPTAAVRGVLGRLPRGAVPVGGGPLVLRITSYGFLFVAARSMSARSFAKLSVLYALVYTVGPGLFLPFEQDIGRSLADRRTAGWAAARCCVGRSTWRSGCSRCWVERSFVVGAAVSLVRLGLLLRTAMTLVPVPVPAAVAER
jgi:hypothetical protein